MKTKPITEPEARIAELEGAEHRLKSEVDRLITNNGELLETNQKLKLELADLRTATADYVQLKEQNDKLRQTLRSIVTNILSLKLK